MEAQLRSSGLTTRATAARASRLRTLATEHVVNYHFTNMKTHEFDLNVATAIGLATQQPGTINSCGTSGIPIQIQKMKNLSSASVSGYGPHQTYVEGIFGFRLKHH